MNEQGNEAWMHMFDAAQVAIMLTISKEEHFIWIQNFVEHIKSEVVGQCFRETNIKTFIYHSGVIVQV